MKTEVKVLKFNAFINFIVALIKIIFGNIFNFAALIADGFYTVSDLITDFLALIGSKIGKKRPNKRYPLGYGNFENIMQMLMGFMIFLVGFVVIIMSFSINYVKPNLIVLLPMLIVILLKTYSSKLLFQVGKKINSSLLITSSRESFLDVYSTSLLILVLFLGQFFPKFDMIASIIMGLIIVLQAGKIIYQNAIVLIGKSSNNEEIIDMVTGIFQKYHKISLNKVTVIKHGSFYHLILNINIKNDYTIRSLIRAEAKIKKEIKEKKLKVSFIDFDITKKSD